MYIHLEYSIEFGVESFFYLVKNIHLCESGINKSEIFLHNKLILIVSYIMQ